GEGFDPSLIGGSVSLQELIDSGLIKAEDIILTGNGLTVEELQQEEIPGFVAAQVAEDPALQQKIADTTDFDVEQIITDAPDRLKQEQAATEQQREQILEAIEQLSADQVDPLFEEEEEPVEEDEDEDDEDEDEEDDTGSKPPAPAPVDYTLTVYWKTEDGTTLDFDTQTIPSGESYTTTRKEFENYAFSETTGDAVSGTMDGDKTVTYLYRAVTYTLTVKYLDRFDGAELQDATTQSIRGGTTYTVTCPETMYVNRYIGSSQVAAEYRFYKNEGDLSGTMTGSKTVTLYYAHPNHRFLDDPTTDDLTLALGEDGVTDVFVTNATEERLDMIPDEAAESPEGDEATTQSPQVVIAAGQMVHIQSGSAQVAKGAEVRISGRLIFAGDQWTISGTISGDSSGYCLVEIQNGTCTVAATGKVSSSSTADAIRVGESTDGSTEGTLILDGGTVENTSTVNPGTAIGVNGKGVVMNDGTVTAHSYAMRVSNDVTIHGGTVRSTGDNAIYCDYGTVNVQGGTIKTDAATAAIRLLNSGGTILNVGTAQQGNAKIQITGQTGILAEMNTSTQIGAPGDNSSERITIEGTGGHAIQTAGDLFVYSGTIQATFGSSDAISASMSNSSAKMEIHGGTILGARYGVNIETYEAVFAGGTITGDGSGIGVTGTFSIITIGSESGDGPEITGQNQYGADIIAVGRSDKPENIVTVKNGTITGKTAGLMNKDSTVILEGGTFSGENYGIINQSVLTMRGGVAKCTATDGYAVKTEIKTEALTSNCFDMTGGTLEYAQKAHHVTVTYDNSVNQNSVAVDYSGLTEAGPENGSYTATGIVKTSDTTSESTTP
ncbi:MAG: MucBP domain-containing protein, partial [Clostridia bacterium]|nr:MucBP domain-containing protein [Clostridia bacterium]